MRQKNLLNLSHRETHLVKVTLTTIGKRHPAAALVTEADAEVEEVAERAIALP
mgnify:CR=1 FL=1